MKEPTERERDVRERALVQRAGIVLFGAFFLAFNITVRLWQDHKLWFFVILIVAPIIGSLLQKRSIKFLLIWETVSVGLCVAGWMINNHIIVLSVAMAISLFCPLISGVVSSARWYRQQKAERLLTLENCKSDPEMYELLQSYVDGCVYIVYPIKSQLISDCIETGVFIQQKNKQREERTTTGRWYKVAEDYHKRIEKISQKLS